MVNISLLEEKMRIKNIGKDKLASAINVDRSTLYRKFSADGDKFTIEEAQKITSALDLSAEDATSIFFSNTVA